MNSIQIQQMPICDIPSVFELKQNFAKYGLYGCTIVAINSNIKDLYLEVQWS